LTKKLCSFCLETMIFLLSSERSIITINVSNLKNCWPMMLTLIKVTKLKNTLNNKMNRRKKRQKTAIYLYLLFLLVLIVYLRAKAYLSRHFGFLKNIFHIFKKGREIIAILMVIFKNYSLQIRPIKLT
jgi:hypothetical protein